MFNTQTPKPFAKASRRTNVRRPNRQRRLQTERLEDRTLMAVGVAPGPGIPYDMSWDDPTIPVQPASAILGADGTLRVFGTANDDDIKITSGIVQPWNPNPSPVIQVTIKDNNGQTLLSQSFAVLSYQLMISKIEVYAGDGDDMVENNTNMASALFGGAGNDTLYGGLSDDQIWGQDGDDGLFGGGGGIDYIDPGPGDDRVLFFNGTSNYTGPWYDSTGLNHATIHFGNSGPTSTSADGYSQPKTFGAGQWSISEIKLVDQALKFVHHTQGNTKLLKQADGQNLMLNRVGFQDPHVSNTVTLAWNDSLGNIYLTTNLIGMGENQVLQTFLHEIGHNWDDENPQWQTFKDISNWTDSNPNNNNYATSNDGNWWYHTTATFAREYGQENPKEDFATAFAAYFVHEMGLPYQGTWKDANNTIGWSAIPEKIDFIDDWLAGMSPNYSVLLGNYIDFGRTGRSDTDADSNMRSIDTKESTYSRVAANDTLMASGDSSTDKVSPEIVDQALLELLDEDAAAEEQFTTLRSPLAR